jgi:regulator of microtubule dynamics protein 3
MGWGSLFRTPFDKPIPDNHFSNFVRRFSYEVAELSWWERKMASTLFADPPVSTMEEARDHFLAAEALKPDGWKENRQYLAKCYISLQDYKAAIEWLDKANELPVNNPDVS